MMKINYKGNDYELSIEMYLGGSTALLVSDEEGSSIQATVDNGNRYPQNWVLLENQEIVNLLTWKGNIIGDHIEDLPSEEDPDKLHHLYVLTDEFYDLVKRRFKLDEYDVIDEDQMRELLKMTMELQEAGEKISCPRCGHDRMKEDLVHNALSRRESIYICSECGQNEAMLDMAEQDPLPLSKWSMSAILR